MGTDNEQILTALTQIVIHSSPVERYNYNAGSLCTSRLLYCYDFIVELIPAQGTRFALSTVFAYMSLCVYNSR